MQSLCSRMFAVFFLSLQFQIDLQVETVSSSYDHFGSENRFSRNFNSVLWLISKSIFEWWFQNSFCRITMCSVGNRNGRFLVPDPFFGVNPNITSDHFPECYMPNVFLPCGTRHLSCYC